MFSFRLYSYKMIYILFTEGVFADIHRLKKIRAAGRHYCLHVSGLIGEFITNCYFTLQS